MSPLIDQPAKCFRSQPQVPESLTITGSSSFNSAGIYKHLWRPEEIGITKARQLIEPLSIGVALMKREPQRFIALNPSNGWGSYDGFVPWIERYIAACCEFPEAEVSVSR